MARPLEHLVLFSVVATDSRDGEESLIVQLAWEIVSISKIQVLLKDQVYVCPGGGAPRNLPPGINPEAVQAAGNLDSALKQFHTTLTKLGGSTFSLMTFGPTALRCLLHPQAYKICLGLQKYLHRYLDIVKEFARAFPTTPVPTTVDKMGSLVGIGSEGVTVRPGVDELAVMGQVALKLIQQGHVFQSQEIIRDDTKLEVTPDPNQVKENCVVKMRGLPFQASLKDVAGFLSGLNYIPGGIVFSLNNVGRRTGEALAVMETPEQAQLAIQRDRQYLNQRYIEVFSANPEEFNRMTGGGGGSTGGVCVARLQGLPYRVTEEDIVEFFGRSAEVKGGKDGVMIVHYADGKATGDGFALFNNEQDLTSALQLNKSMIGSRYVELYKSSLKEFQMVLSRSGTSDEQQHFSKLLGLEITPDPELEGLKGSVKNCVKLRGIPFTATAEDVIHFFGDLKEEIALQGVHMVVNAVNRPTGECYVRMKTVEAAMDASDKLHKKYIERRYIEVFQCSGDEVFRALQDQGVGGGGGGRGQSYRGERGFRGGDRGGRRGYMDDERRRRPSGGCSVKVRGLPYSATEGDICGFFADYEIRNCDIELIMNNVGRPTGIAYVSFPNREIADLAIREKDGKHLGSRYLELSHNY